MADSKYINVKINEAQYGLLDNEKHKVVVMVWLPDGAETKSGTDKKCDYDIDTMMKEISEVYKKHTEM